jgi:hypothetical protein
MAVVASVKATEQLRVGAIEAEAAAQKRAPGLQIVVIAPSGEKHIAHQPPQLLDVTPPAREAEPASSDAEAG